MALPAIDEKWPSRPLRTGRSRRGFSPLLKAVQFSAARRAVLSAKSLENGVFPGQGGEELRTRNPPKNHKAGLVGPAFPIVELSTVDLVSIADPECQSSRIPALYIPQLLFQLALSQRGVTGPRRRILYLYIPMARF